MLSYNTSSSGAMSSGRQSIPSSPKASRLPTTLSNGVMTNGSAPSAAEAPAKDQHIWLVTGPAGCGKSTVAKHIADSLQLPFVEGDEVCT
jgi:gluconokinase